MKKILPVLLLLLTVVSGAKAAGRTIPEIPSLSGWEENMKTFGLKYIAPIPLGAVNEASVWYYDGIKVYYQIAEYTKDDKYLKGMEYCRDWYRDKFALVLPKAQGWRLFPHGLFIDYKKTGDEKSKQAILKLATTAAFSDQRKNPGRMAPVSLSREVAYNINCYLTAHELGDQRFSVPDTFIEVALGHLDTWNSWLKTDRKSYPYGTQGEGFQPFMVGLTCEALIRYYESKDADSKRKERIISTIMETANLMWNEAWQSGSRAFYYESTRKGPAPDLNLLIVPLYGWLWHRTGDMKFLYKGDELFAGGVEGARLGGKQFSQNYRWSFDYVKWRSIQPEPDPKAENYSKERALLPLKNITAFPNPAKLSESLKITFDRLVAGCTVTIFNSSDAQVRELLSGKKDYVEWDGKDEKKKPVPAGSYTYTVTTSEGAEKTGKLEIRK